jgi:hypothetical protein
MTLFIFTVKLMVTGKEGNRIIRAYNEVRFYKTDMSGKCDAAFEFKTALTKLIGNPAMERRKPNNRRFNASNR